MQVVQGEAVEGCYHVAPDGYVDLQYETAVRCGEVLAGQDAGVHTVRNSSPTGELLVTVHVYSPPLRDIRQFRPRPEPTGEGQRRDPNRTPTIVIVGGGFSGAMAAAQTLRRARQAGLTVKVVLVERRGAIGEGLAYSTRESAHLLNVPAGRMSAWPDRPDDFVQWASRRHGEVRPTDFLPRQWYGEYVRESLLSTAEEAGESAKLAVVFDEVRRVARHPSGGWMVHLARETSLRAEAVILTVGHRPPSDPIGTAVERAPDALHFGPVAPVRHECRGAGRSGRRPGERPDGGGHGALAQPAAAPGPDHPGLAAWALAAGSRRHAGAAGRFDFVGIRTGRRARRCPCPDPVAPAAAQGA